MKGIFIIILILITLGTGTSFADENERQVSSNISEELEKFNLTRTNNSNFTRRLTGAVPGVDGRIINQDPPEVVATEPPVENPAPTNPPPPQEEKAACGPTVLVFMALIPLIINRRV